MSSLDADPAFAVRSARQMRMAGRLDEAEAVLRLMLDIDPADTAARYELSLTLLAAGRFSDAWPHFEARLLLDRPPALPFPVWRGQIVSGRRLLVVAEPALRAGLLFAASLPKLVETGAAVTYLCHPALVAEAQGLGVDALPMSGEVEFPDPDFWAMEGSIPGLTGDSGSPELSRWARSLANTAKTMSDAPNA
jgi:hypothetical protein